MCLYWLLHGCSEDCECIVVVTWTRQLFLRLPFAISLPYSPITTVVCNQASHSVVKLTNRFYRINSFTSPRKCVHMRWIHSHEGNVNTWRNYVHMCLHELRGRVQLKGLCLHEGIMFPCVLMKEMHSHEGNVFTWRKCDHMKEMRPQEGNVFTWRNYVHMRSHEDSMFKWEIVFKWRQWVHMTFTGNAFTWSEYIHKSWRKYVQMKETCSNEGNIFTQTECVPNPKIF